MRTVVAMLSLLILLPLCGCVERRMRLLSEPPGALVYLNGEEVARTPAVVPLTWYGRYDVVVRKEGFETLDEARWVTPPWWGWVPLDLIVEVLPVRVSHTPELRFLLREATENDAGLLGRAEVERAAHGDQQP